jgi:hypothetical protein
MPHLYHLSLFTTISVYPVAAASPYATLQWHMRPSKVSTYWGTLCNKHQSLKLSQVPGWKWRNWTAAIVTPVIHSFLLFVCLQPPPPLSLSPPTFTITVHTLYVIATDTTSLHNVKMNFSSTWCVTGVYGKLFVGEGCNILTGSQETWQEVSKPTCGDQAWQTEPGT